jgi:CubicO group peptidase (beta-lactamase class C family)
MPERFGGVAALLGEAIGRRIFPGAAIEVGTAAGPIWQHASGHLTYDSESPRVTADTIYDLASLTKVIATATLAMRAVDAHRLDLDRLIADRFAEWRGTDRSAVTVRDLLSHSSGLTAYLPLFRDHSGRREFEHAICTLPLEYPPRTQSTYSDLGFILLGFLLEDTAASPLAAQFNQVVSLLDPAPLTFNPPRDWRVRTAPTEYDSWRGRHLVGEVHDENAWALGGAAGHAGLFGTAAAVGTFARAALRTIAGDPVLAAPATMREFIRRRTEIPNSSRALGWDTMLPTSSCGTRLSPTAIGHTGFTGTSLWVDWERDLYVVLLTNRVHPSREHQGIREVRQRVHDEIVQELRPE